MTVRELSQYYWLKKEIAHDRERLEALRYDLAVPSSPNLSGMPGGGHSDAHRMENAVVERLEQVSEVESIIAEKIKRCEAELVKLERYIQAIPDSYTRQLFTLRFCDCLPWPMVAQKIGGISPDSARVIVKRYVRQHRNDV